MSETVFVIENYPSELVWQLVGFLTFTLIAVVGLVVSFLRKELTYRPLLILLFGVLAVLMSATSALGAWSVFVRHAGVVREYRAGGFKLLKGCLSRFRPSQSPGHTPDQILLGDRLIQYSDNMMTGGYHLTEASGGYIHADSWVALYMVGNIIARVDVIPHACPAAPP